MKQIFSFWILFLFAHYLNAQQFSSSDPEYIRLVQLGEKAMLSEKYDSCITYYKDAFKIRQTSVLSTLRAAACAYSSDDIDYYDEQLSKAVELNLTWSKSTFQREEFSFLWNTGFQRELELRHDLTACKLGYDLELMAEFDIIAESDQVHRREMSGVIEQYGWQSPQMDSLWALQTPIDEANTERITELIDERGYPGQSIVGPRHMGTAFMVIQHADTATQRKYLPILTEAANEGELKWKSLALLIDRVNNGLGKPQIYGSQVSTDMETGENYFFEIENPEEVDKRREEVGLGPLSEYAQRFNFTWDIDKHKARHSKEKE